MFSYCSACAETVPPSLDSAGGVSRCPKCGLGLGPILEAKSPALLVQPFFETVLVAEDTRLFAQILKDGLVQEGLARRVFVGDNGEEFLTLYSEHLYRDERVDLAIIDLEMPVLDGGATAIALRAMEAGARAHRVPIVFFTSHPVNDAIRSVIRHCRPAHYLNKGADADPARLLKRVREVMRGMQL